MVLIDSYELVSPGEDLNGHDTNSRKGTYMSRKIREIFYKVHQVSSNESEANVILAHVNLHRLNEVLNEIG